MLDFLINPRAWFSEIGTALSTGGTGTVFGSGLASGGLATGVMSNIGAAAAKKAGKEALGFGLKKIGKSILKVGLKATGKLLLTAVGSIPVWGWIAIGTIAVIGAAIAAYNYNKQKQNTEMMENMNSIADQMKEEAMAEAGVNTIVSPDRDQLESLAQANAGLGNQGLTNEQKNAMAAVNQGLNEVAQPPTAEEIQQMANDQGFQSQDEALNRFNEMLAQLNQGESPESVMAGLQEENKIDNPFSETIGENKEDTEEVIKQEIEKYEEELDFDKSDFDDLDGYKFMINNTLVTLYVKSDITLMSDDETFQSITHTDITSEKYTDNKGQTHAISNAYDADGNKLDSVIMSTQIGYLEIGLDGANGTAKFSGTGNEDAYEVHGYGETSFGRKEYEVSIVGSYDLKNEEKEKESLLGTNSNIIAEKEYKFRDDGAIELTESETNALFDTFTASIKWACDVMREVNLQSYVLDLGEAEFIMGERQEDNDENEDNNNGEEIEIEENGITYTYDENATITNRETGVTYLVKDLLEQNVTTMEDLIERGFEPNTINGKEYENKEDLEDAITETKPKFTIEIDEPASPENYERETIYIAEDGTRYYFTTKCSHRYHIITENGEEYTIEEALEIYTIDELIDNGLNCKISVI